MTERIVQRRQGKKRNIARIFDAMYGLNAVYPEVQASTPAFATLIIFCWLIISDGLIHPAETRLLTKLVAPRIKLRRDDVEFVCNQIQERGMDERHLKWLVSFIQSGIAPDAKRELLESLDRLAMADHLLHPAEAAVIRKARELLGDTPLSG
jgi:uncharacterized tellurite resistance protein B-like protein